jgi:hypothetical protein
VGARTCAPADALVEEQFLPQWQRRFTETLGHHGHAHRALAAKPKGAAIGSIRERRVVANDDTTRFHEQSTCGDGRSRATDKGLQRTFLTLPKGQHF